MTKNAPTGRGPGRLWRGGALALLTALLAVVAPAVLPASASAAGYYGGSGGYDGGYNGGYDGGYNGGYNDGGSSSGYSGAVVVFPVLNCVQPGSNGAYTAVLGYRNTSSTTYTIAGDYNFISPSSYNGR